MIAPRVSSPGAVVFGAGGPIGQALVGALVNEGARVHLVEGIGTGVVPRLRSLAVDFSRWDAASTESMEQAIDEAAKSLGRIDVLVKCPFTTPAPHEGGENSTDWLEWMGNELLAAMNLLHLGKRTLRREGGTLMVVSSLLGMRDDSGFGGFAVANRRWAGSVLSLAPVVGDDAQRAVVFTIEDDSGLGGWERRLSGTPSDGGGGPERRFKENDPKRIAKGLVGLIEESLNWIADRAIRAFYEKEVLS